MLQRQHFPGRNIPNFGTLRFSLVRTYATWDGSVYDWWGDQAYRSYEMTSDGAFYTPPCSNSTRILVYPTYVSASAFNNNFCRAS